MKVLELSREASERIRTYVLPYFSKKLQTNKSSLALKVLELSREASGRIRTYVLLNFSKKLHTKKIFSCFEGFRGIVRI